MTFTLFQVTDITFDFEGEDITEEEKESIIDDAKSCLWDLSPTNGTNNLKDLKDVIFREMGYSVIDVKVNYY